MNTDASFLLDFGFDEFNVNMTEDENNNLTNLNTTTEFTNYDNYPTNTNDFNTTFSNSANFFQPQADANQFIYNDASNELNEVFNQASIPSNKINMGSYFDPSDLSMFPDVSNDLQPEQSTNTDPLDWMDTTENLNAVVEFLNPADVQLFPNMDQPEDDYIPDDSFGLGQTNYEIIDTRDTTPEIPDKADDSDMVEVTVLEMDSPKWENPAESQAEAPAEAPAEDSVAFAGQMYPNVEEALIAYDTSNRCTDNCHDHEEDHGPTVESMMQLFNSRCKDGEYRHTRKSVSKFEAWHGKFVKLPKPQYEPKHHYTHSVELPINVAHIPIDYYSDMKIRQFQVKGYELPEKNPYILKRTRYYRGPEILATLHTPGFKYQFHENNSDSLIYEPEIIRVQLYEDTENKKILPINHTRFGMCPFCPHIKFYDMRTSAYGQHLAFHHGICTDGYLLPEPLRYGRYLTKKDNKDKKEKPRITTAQLRESNAIVCPVCHDLIEVEVSNTTSKVQPYYTYLRHFKLKHRLTSEDKPEEPATKLTVFRDMDLQPQPKVKS